STASIVSLTPRALARVIRPLSLIDVAPGPAAPACSRDASQTNAAPTPATIVCKMVRRRNGLWLSMVGFHAPAFDSAAAAGWIDPKCGDLHRRAPGGAPVAVYLAQSWRDPPPYG